jgi:NlpC/P60 family putative phage cell wall peptidase
MVTRTQIIEEVKTWIGTPYHHQAGVKGVGVDCAYLVGHVAQNVGSIMKFKVEPYSVEWHWHSKEERMCSIIESFGAKEIPVNAFKPGDILAFKYGRVCSHLGIMIDFDKFVHAHIKTGKVLVNTLTGEYLERLERVYQFPNIEEETCHIIQTTLQLQPRLELLDFKYQK